MEKAIIAKKIGMTQIFDQNGNVVPVTVVQAGPCQVVQKKTSETDGYSAVQLGFEDASVKRVNKPLKGHYEKADVACKKILKEFDLDGDINVGDVIKADVFNEGEQIDVVGISRGKGFAGAVKRHGSHMQRHSHGVGPVHRSVGSLGAGSSPSRVMKGKHMAGHMGHEQITVQNLVIAKIDAENNIIAIKGAIPGPKGGYVFVKSAVKK